MKLFTPPASEINTSKAKYKAITLVISALIAVVAAVSFISMSDRPASTYGDKQSDDYVVEHVGDRIMSKLSAKVDADATESMPELSDTGYRIRTRSLVVDASAVSPNDTIEDVYTGTDEEKIERILYQSDSLSSVYDFGNDTEYVAYLDIAGDNGKTEHPQDAVFVYDNTGGEAVSSVRYDKESGLAYIPKEFFEEDKVKNLEDGQVELLAQTLVRYDLDDLRKAREQDKAADVYGDEPAVGEASRNNTIPAEVVTKSGKASKMSQVPFLGNQFSVKVVDAADAEAVDLKDIAVSINDGAIELTGENDPYLTGGNLPSLAYNSETGDLTVMNVSPSMVMNLTADVSSYVAPSMAARVDAPVNAGEIDEPTDNAYKIGHYGTANASGGYGTDGALTKTVKRFASGSKNWSFTNITKSIINEDHSTAYVISIGKCPSSLGKSWDADTSKKWNANCVHASYPNGTENPPSGGYYKVLDTDTTNQTITVAFFITCDKPSQQEGGMVLTFDAPRAGTFTVKKKANANAALGSLVAVNVPNASYGIYDTQKHASAAGSTGRVKKITTNSSGLATVDLEKGTYYIKELSVPWPYLVSDQVTKIVIKPNQTTKNTLYDDTIPPIQIVKRIVPSAGAVFENDVMSGSTVLLHAKTTVNADGKSISTTLQAKTNVGAVSIRNSSTSVLNNPTSSSSKFSASNGTISSMSAEETITVTQTIKSGMGWTNTSKTANICSIAIGGARTDMCLALPGENLAGTVYGIYSNSGCTSKIGQATLDANGIGYYGKKSGEILQSNTTYYVKEISGVRGYTPSPDVYPVTTSRNSQVSVNVSDSFTTLILTKKSGLGKPLTDKVAQFSLRGARYGVFPDQASAATHDASRVCTTPAGRKAIITTDKFGMGSEVTLGAGTYYVAEVASDIAPVAITSNLSEPSNIDKEILQHGLTAKSNGKFMIDQNVYPVTMISGKTTFVTSAENIPVRLQLKKQSTHAGLAATTQFSVEGAVFGVYTTEAAAKSAPVGNYGSFTPQTTGAVAILYGNKDGLTTVSGDLPLGDYYIKEIRAPRNYKHTGSSYWMMGNRKVTDEVLHITVSDFLASNRYIDGFLTTPEIIKVNEPEDITVQVHKTANEVSDSKKVIGDAMNLAGARFAIYKTYEDARDDVNRVSFRTDDQAAGDNSTTTLLTTKTDGYSNKAVGLPANFYWIREIEPPHIVSEDPDQNAKNIEESMYVLDTEPVKGYFPGQTSIDMMVDKDDKVKPVSLTIGKFAMSIDPRHTEAKANLHVGEKDANGVPYNDAYTDDAFEGAIFGLFNTREEAENAVVTDDINDISVEQKAYDSGAVAVMISDKNGVCGTVNNLKWKEDGYYVRELKAPSTGCYQRNDSVLQILCDKNSENSEHMWLSIDKEKISKHFEVDEVPNYYYVKIEKTSSEPSVLEDTSKYDLEGIHFGIYKTYEEAAAATEEEPGRPMYNLYTKKVTYEDGSVHYEAVSGLTGPGTFWAKELGTASGKASGFQQLSSPIQVEAKLGEVPRYETTPIVPEYGAPVPDPVTGKLGYKTAADIDAENNVTVRLADEKTLEKIEDSKEAERMAGLLSGAKLKLLSDSAVSAVPSSFIDDDSTQAGIVGQKLLLSTETAYSTNALATALPGAWIMGVHPSSASAFYDQNGLKHHIIIQRRDSHISSIKRHNFVREYRDINRNLLQRETTSGSDATFTASNFSETSNSCSGLVKMAINTDGTGDLLINMVLFDKGGSVLISPYKDEFRQYTITPTTGYKVTKWSFSRPSYVKTYDKTSNYFNDGADTQSTTTGGTILQYDQGNSQYFWATTSPCTYTVSFNANGGSGASANKTATYDAAMPAVSKPTRTGYTFQGYYDAASGGTQYYKADGTSARTWNKTSNTTLYAHWTPITYTVKYEGGDGASAISGAVLSDTYTYDKSYSLRSNLFHKLGKISTKWKNKSTGASYNAGQSVSNLATTQDATVTFVADWDKDNRYTVKYHQGLNTQWGPSAKLDAGWTDGYQATLPYDECGKCPATALEPVHYSHDYFAFKYWDDHNGHTYSNQELVRNLVSANGLKELWGVWTPDFDYGVDCESNIIVNQPIIPSSGSITIQKLVNTNGIIPEELKDLSGITFELFSDEECAHSVDTAQTDSRGVAIFSKLDPATTYYVKETGAPARLANLMEINDNVKPVRSDSTTSYDFVNESKQLTVELVKKPADDSVSAISPTILDNIPPTGAKFAVYASEEDASNDENRLSFFDERGHLTTVAIVLEVVEKDGVKIATTTITGLPCQDLWVRELVAPDHGNHEYILNSEPIFVSKDSATIGDTTAIPVEVSNDITTVPGLEISKGLSEESLSKLPEIMHGDKELLSLTDGIEYALYLNRGEAENRSEGYISLIEIQDGKGVLPELPYGTYYIVEWSVPDKAMQAGISRSDKIVPITINSESRTGDNVASMEDDIVTKQLYLKKVDEDTRDAVAGVVFDIYADESMSVLLCTTNATDANGIAVADADLIPGRRYFAKERFDSLPAEYTGQGLGADNTWSGWVELSESDEPEKAVTITNKKNDQKGSMSVKKTSNNNASPAGAVFSVYDASGALYGELITDENGEARLDDIPIGHYTVVETTPLTLHSFTEDGESAQQFEGDVPPDECWQVNDGEPIVNYQGYIKVKKQSSNPEITDALPAAYSLAGAIYSIYPVEDNNVSSVPLSVTMVTDANGTCEPVAVPLGSYKVVETTEPEGFSTPEEQKEFYVTVSKDNVTEAGAVEVQSLDTPISNPMANFIVEKRSAETLDISDGSPQGTTSMEHTKFVIEYTSQQAQDYNSAISAPKERKWVIETDDNGRAAFDEDSIISEESDEFYRDSDGNAALPVGTIVVKEIVPPTGYTIGTAPTAAYRFSNVTGKFEELMSDGSGVIEWAGDPTFTAANNIYRADISFKKVDAYDENKIMEGIPFVLSLLDEDGEPIEQHLLVTDSNGYFSSASGAIDPVNENDQWIPGDALNGNVSDDFAPVDSRIWFSGTPDEVVPAADKGALIYGDYELREYYREDTTHYQALEPIRFSVRGDNEESWVEIDGKIVKDGNLTEGIGDIKNHSIHITSTEMTDNGTGTHVMGDGSWTATETITFADATPGEEYQFQTNAYDVDTFMPISKNMTDIDGSIFEQQAGGYFEYQAESDSGSITISVSFEGYEDLVKGKKIGLITEVYHNGYLSDIHNIDLRDDREAISSTEIGTTALDADTGAHIGLSDGHVDLVDTVKYENLVPGQEYKLRGTLMDKFTKTELKDVAGNSITVEKTFVPDTRDGSADIVFSFDMDSNIDFTTVVFEELYLSDMLVAEHKDIYDEEQTVIYPSVHTVARDAETGTFQGNPEKEIVTVADKVSYANLIPQKQYELRGCLYIIDENDNKIFVEGTETTATFTADAENGTVEVFFNAPADIVRGYRVLVGEEIYLDGSIVACHDDVSLNEQIVSYPSVDTAARDIRSENHVGNGENDTHLVDVVHLEGLKVREEYRIDGTVMMRDGNGNIHSTEINASKTFTAVSPVEDHELIFDIPNGFAGCDAVVFEELLSADGTHILATHKDIEDEGQTVHYPKIGTVALNPSASTHVGSNIDNRIIDTVMYENLVPGYRYELVGMLVDKETGEFIDNEEGTAPITSSVKFSTEAPDGSVEVPFDLGNVDVSGKTVVVFEELFVIEQGDQASLDEENDKSTLIATHCDIDADKQTMFYPSVATEARDIDTGTHVGSSLRDGKIVDKVEYTNLIVGYEYEIRGTLMDKETGEPVLIEGEPVTAFKNFMPEERNGFVEIEFEAIPQESVADRTIVVFEKILLAGYEMASHENISDEQQSVSYPMIRTTAKDSETLLHEGNIGNVIKEGDSQVKVIDTVTYTNLVPGREYKVVGEMVGKYAEEPIPVSTGEFSFIPQEASGSVDVVFLIDKEIARGQVLVAFEKLFDDAGNEIANHEDLNDEGQTVSYPVIGTQARDKNTNTRAGSVDGISIIDTVYYEGLIEGHEYTVYGTLMDRDTQLPVTDADGNLIEANTTFTADAEGKGNTNVEFSSSLVSEEMLAGKTIVVFERLEEASENEEEIASPDEGQDNEEPGEPAPSDPVENEHPVIAVHEDIEDEEQTIHYAKISRTLAHADNGTKQLTYSDSSLMSDMVTYENVVPGVEYALDGSMMNKSRQETQSVNGQGVREYLTFVPEETSGEVELIFELDATTGEIEETVVFEKMTVNGAVTGSHMDLNSEDQSIHGVADELIDGNDVPLSGIEELGSTLLATGDRVHILLGFMASIALVIVGMALIRKGRLEV